MAETTGAVPRPAQENVQRPNGTGTNPERQNQVQNETGRQSLAQETMQRAKAYGDRIKTALGGNGENSDKTLRELAAGKFDAAKGFVREVKEKAQNRWHARKPEERSPITKTQAKDTDTASTKPESPSSGLTYNNFLQQTQKETAHEPTAAERTAAEAKSQVEKQLQENNIAPESKLGKEIADFLARNPDAAVTINQLIMRITERRKLPSESADNSELQEIADLTNRVNETTNPDEKSKLAKLLAILKEIALLLSVSAIEAAESAPGAILEAAKQ